MKLKFLFAIVSCSAIALSVGVPSIAQTVKDSVDHTNYNRAVQSGNYIPIMRGMKSWGP